MRFTLTLWQQEMKEIPGADAVKSVDSMKLEVLVRDGTKIVIHPDQVRMWKSKGEKYEADFLELSNQHTEKYEGMLASVIQQSAAGASSTSAMAEVDDEPPPEVEEGPEPELVSFESLAKLEAADPVAVRVSSEVAGVELLKTASNKLFLLAEKQKSIPRFAIIGGFGSGKQHS